MPPRRSVRVSELRERRSHEGQSGIRLEPSEQTATESRNPTVEESEQNEEYEEDYVPIESESTARTTESDRVVEDTNSHTNLAPEQPQPRLGEQQGGGAEYSNRLLEQLLGRLGEPRTAPRPDLVKIISTMSVLGTEKFQGGDDPFGADTWIKRVERNLTILECPESLKINVAVRFLGGEAAIWWQTIEDRYGAYYTEQFVWQGFKDEFMKKYFPEETRERIESRFLELKQGTRNVRDYAEEFMKLRCFSRYGRENERLMIKKWIRGLRPELASRLQAIQHTEFAGVVEAAVNVEEAVIEEDRQRMKEGEEKKAKHQQQKTHSENKKSHKEIRDNRPPKRLRGPPICFNCGQSGHRKDACTVSPISQTQYTRPSVTCWNCGEAGHIRTNCPKPRVSFPPSDSSQSQKGRNQLIPALPAPPKRLAIEPASQSQNQPAAGRIYALNANSETPQLQSPITGMYT